VFLGKVSVQSSQRVGECMKTALRCLPFRRAFSCLPSHNYIAIDNQLQITQDAMDHFELEMRISTMPLSELTPETDLKDIFNHLKIVSINAEEE
jgi:hypothetical protein